MAKILITGGTGMVGKRLTKCLKNDSNEVVWLSRRQNNANNVECFLWDVDNGTIDEKAFDGVDCIVHLAGANVGGRRWTKQYKQQLWDSRVKSTALLFEAVKKVNAPIKTFVGASAIGFYGDSGTDTCTEKSPKGTGFLADLCQAWEGASLTFEEMGCRRAVLRLGLVLNKGEGAMKKMELPAKMGLGSYFGNGQQYYSWIHIDDLCQMFMHAIKNDAISGVYNVVAPETVTNKAFARQLNKALGRPFIPAPLPTFAARLLMGEMADIVLNSNKVSAEKVLKTGFEFEYAELEGALGDLYK